MNEQRYCQRCLAPMESVHEDDGNWLSCTGCEDTVSADDPLLSLSDSQLTMILEAEAADEACMNALVDEAVESFLDTVPIRW